MAARIQISITFARIAPSAEASRHRTGKPGPVAGVCVSAARTCCLRASADQCRVMEMAPRDEVVPAEEARRGSAWRKLAGRRPSKIGSRRTSRLAGASVRRERVAIRERLRTGVHSYDGLFGRCSSVKQVSAVHNEHRHCTAAGRQETGAPGGPEVVCAMQR